MAGRAVLQIEVEQRTIRPITNDDDLVRTTALRKGESEQHRVPHVARCVGGLLAHNGLTEYVFVSCKEQHHLRLSTSRNQRHLTPPRQRLEDLQGSLLRLDKACALRSTRLHAGTDIEHQDNVFILGYGCSQYGICQGHGEDTHQEKLQQERYVLYQALQSETAVRFAQDTF